MARQRDLRELIGDTVPGADRINFGDALGHWEGRFHKITLEDRNLPAIAERRVLKCRNEGARQELQPVYEFDRINGKSHLQAARKVATSAQRKPLRNILSAGKDVPTR